MFTVKSINKVFKEDGLPVELVKGEGYFYYIFNEPRDSVYETRSVYVYRLSDLTKQHWIDEGRMFALETVAHFGINRRYDLEAI
jgi:hypothetical protein